MSAIFETAAEVDAVMAAATRRGAKVTKPARSAVWGGYSGYFADRDGHLWKVVSDNKPPRGRQRREEAARANANATFDFASALIGVKSLSEVVELTTAHARKQFEAVTEQTKDLTAAAQKLATETAEPIKSGVTKAFKKVA